MVGVDDGDKEYAMKSILKKEVQRKNQVVFVEREKKLLEAFRFPFVVELKCTFQNEDTFFMVFEFMAGGDLFYHLKQAKRFGEPRARFYAAQVVLALEYLHKKGIIYR